MAAMGAHPPGAIYEHTLLNQPRLAWEAGQPNGPPPAEAIVPTGFADGRLSVNHWNGGHEVLPLPSRVPMKFA